MSDSKNNTETQNGNWVATELQKARAEYKAAKGKDNKKYLAAVNKLDALNHIIYWSQDKRDKWKLSNQMQLDKFSKSEREARAEFKDITKMLSGRTIRYDATTKKYIDMYKKETGKSVSITMSGSVINSDDFKDWLTKKKSEAGKKLKDAKTAVLKYNNYQAQITYANQYIAKYGQPTKVAAKTNTGGKVDAPAPENTTPQDSPQKNTPPKNTTTQNSHQESGNNNNGVNQQGSFTEGKPYQDKDGNMVTPLLDKNGNQIGYKFKDKDGKDQTLMNDEINKTNIKLDDIKKALEAGDLKKALELLLQALLGKQQLEAQQNQQRQTTQSQEQSSETTDKYTDENTGITFGVTKKNEEILSVSAQQEGKYPTVFTAADFAKAKVDPKEVETALKAGNYQKAGMLVNAVQEAKFVREPELKIDGNDIVLTDAKGQKFILNEQYLMSNAGMKSKKAAGTMKKFREAIATGKDTQGLAKAVSGYFKNNTPKPVMPNQEKGNWSFKQVNKQALDGKEVSITVVNTQGKEVKLKASDFATAYGCDKQQGKKLFKAYARAASNGADVSAELGKVADVAAGNTSRKKTNWGKVAAYGSAALLTGLSVYGIVRATRKSKSSDSSSTTSTTTTASNENSTETKTETTPPQMGSTTVARDNRYNQGR